MSETPEEMDVLAGEYVLGVLEEPEARTVRRLAAEDVRLARAIEAWERHFAPLADAVPPVSPPPALWDRIADSIAESPAPLAELGPAGSPTADVVALAPRRRKVWPWQAATGAALALAAGFAALAFLPQARRTGAAPVEVAALLPAGDLKGAFLAEAHADGSLVLVTLSAVNAPQGHDLELWQLPPGGTKPVSLGVLPASGHRLSLPAPAAAGTQLMVSLENQGGSATGAPTGPVVFEGTLMPRSL